MLATLSDAVQMVATRVKPGDGSEWLFFAIAHELGANGLDSR